MTGSPGHFRICRCSLGDSSYTSGDESLDELCLFSRRRQVPLLQESLELDDSVLVATMILPVSIGPPKICVSTHNSSAMVCTSWMLLLMDKSQED